MHDKASCRHSAQRKREHTAPTDSANEDSGSPFYYPRDTLPDSENSCLSQEKEGSQHQVSKASLTLIIHSLNLNLLIFESQPYDNGVGFRAFGIFIRKIPCKYEC